MAASVPSYRTDFLRSVFSVNFLVLTQIWTENPAAPVSAPAPAPAPELRCLPGGTAPESPRPQDRGPFHTGTEGAPIGPTPPEVRPGIPGPFPEEGPSVFLL